MFILPRWSLWKELRFMSKSILIHLFLCLSVFLFFCFIECTLVIKFTIRENFKLKQDHKSCNTHILSLLIRFFLQTISSADFMFVYWYVNLWMLDPFFTIQNFKTKTVFWFLFSIPFFSINIVTSVKGFNMRQKERGGRKPVFWGFCGSIDCINIDWDTEILWNVKGDIRKIGKLGPFYENSIKFW